MATWTDHDWLFITEVGGVVHNRCLRCKTLMTAPKRGFVRYQIDGETRTTTKAPPCPPTPAE